MRDCGCDALAARSTDSSVNLILACCRGVQKCGGFFACPAAREGSCSAQGQAIGMPGHFPWRHPHPCTVGPSAAVQNTWCPQVQRRWVQHMQPMFPFFFKCGSTHAHVDIPVCVTIFARLVKRCIMCCQWWGLLHYASHTWQFEVISWEFFVLQGRQRAWHN